ncbi:MAG: CoA pyrophosphatase [Thermoplasmata archaeon]|nr:CoA pyrophosphatase [Thermoplasmata archaeon]
MVLRDGNRDVEVLLIERTVRTDDLASGHVALPGGHTDPEDATLAATAIRELTEEVGLGSHDVDLPLRLLGVERADLFGLDVAVFAARLGSRPAQLVPSPAEVAHIFWLPLPRLAEVESVERTTPMGPRKVAAVVDNGRVLWGFTLRILRTYLRPPPSPGS